jgi:hypothetical protein
MSKQSADEVCPYTKERQGWNKWAMRQATVRVCVGCDRYLPLTALIRITRRMTPEAVAAAAEAAAEEAAAEEAAAAEAEAVAALAVGTV